VSGKIACAALNETSARRSLSMAPVTATVNCVCGQVAVEAIGPPIASVICYCDDCQGGARQIESLPNAVSVQDPDGGTACLVYRKDRVRCMKGASLLRHHKIRENSATNRVIATCCNSAMFLSFDDGKHWVDLYRSRCEGDVLPVQMRVCTKFKPDGCTNPSDVPQYSSYPISLLVKLVLAKAAMLLHS
jgi:hypothetical protein